MKELNQFEVEQVSGGCLILASILGRLITGGSTGEEGTGSGTGSGSGGILGGLFGNIFGGSRRR